MKREEVKKYAPYVLAGMAAGILLYSLVIKNDVKPEVDKVEVAPATEVAPPAAVSPTPDAVVGGDTGTVGDYPKKGLPYIESGFRFQFSDCHGLPGSLTVKRGKYFLLDNRDSKAITIAVAGQSYKIAAYGAAVAAVSKVGTHQITCNGGGAASITVQP